MEELGSSPQTSFRGVCGHWSSALTSSLRRTTVCHFACYVFGRNQPDALVDGNNKERGPLESVLSLGIMALESGVKTLKKMLSPRFRMGQPWQHWD